MTNDYTVSEDGKTVTIWLDHEGQRLACLIDAEDFEKVSSIPGAWLAEWNPRTQSFYACTTVGPTKKRHARKKEKN